MTERRSNAHGASRRIQSPERQMADLATFEREYTITRFTQRDLMLDIGSGLWLLPVIAALFAGRFDPDIEPELMNHIRIGIVVISSIAALMVMTVVRRLDDQRTLHVITAISLWTLGSQFVLSFYGPGALGVFQVTILAIAVYSAQFLNYRAVVAVMVLITVLAGVTAWVNYGEPYSPHLLSQLVLFLIVLWVVALSVYAQKQYRVIALLEAERVAFGDTLTGLPNTRMLRRRTESLLDTRNERINRRTGIVLLDLDGFRAINTLTGHREGDRILRAVAGALSDAALPEHLVARTGSDEFTILVPDTTPKQLTELGELYRSVSLAALDRTVTQPLPVDVSVGSAISSDRGDSIEEMLRTADRSMYLQKAAHERGHSSHRALGVGGPVAPEPPVDEAPPRAPEVEGTRWSRYRWSQRPIESRYLSVTWLIAGAALFLSMSMPDAVEHNDTAVLLLVLFTAVGAAIRYFIPIPDVFAIQLLDIIFASLGVAVAIHYTGADSSPAVPVALLVLVFLGWFGPLNRVIPFAILALAIMLYPVFSAPSSEMLLMDKVTVYAGVPIAFVMLAVLYYNHLYLDRAKSLTSQLIWLDPRTGARNRRAFEERMRDELDHLSYADREALAIVLIDLGNFKSISADHGRTTGDELLALVAETLDKASREQDLVCRLGGDEFAVIAPGVDAETARELAVRLVDDVRAAVNASDLAAIEQVRPSAGFALYGMHGRTTDELLTAADVALMSAKTAGRDPNRVSSFVVSL
jgi:diguanylate cyclase (GGDEF)-like protein